MAQRVYLNPQRFIHQLEKNFAPSRLCGKKTSQAHISLKSTSQLHNRIGF
jgi:hypothetical protein